MAESYVTTLLLLDENKILADLNSTAIELGLINNVFETSRIYIYYAVFARVLGNLTRTIAEYINNVDIENTTDEALLEKLIKPFVQKKEARVSKVILEFSRREDSEAFDDIFIPREFEVMTEGDDPIIFRTAESRILWKDSQRVLIPAYSVEFGAINNLMANTLTYFNDDSSYLSGQVQVTNPYAAYGGRDEETAFDTRNRLESFRYGRDGSKEHLQQILYENGISYYGYNIVEYWDGFGSVLIALDVLSEEQYYDIIQNIESVKKEGVKYHYCMVQHIYVNIDVILKITGDDMYTEYQLDEVEQHTFTAVQLYFNNNMGVGNGLSKNRLSAYILQYLVDNRYDIYDIEIVIQPNSELGVTNNNQKVKVEEFEKIYPNKIYTKVEYNAE